MTASSDLPLKVENEANSPTSLCHLQPGGYQPIGPSFSSLLSCSIFCSSTTRAGSVLPEARRTTSVPTWNACLLPRLRGHATVECLPCRRGRLSVVYLRSLAYLTHRLAAKVGRPKYHWLRGRQTPASRVRTLRPLFAD